MDVGGVSGASRAPFPAANKTKQTIYTVFRIPHTETIAMPAPSTKKPAKKAAPSTASANGSARPIAEPAAAPVAASKKKAVTVKPATQNTTRAAHSKPVEIAPVTAPAETRLKRVKKEKVVRDSFTMPKADYEKLGELKQKCLSAGVAVKKSELLRAGLLLLEAVSLDQLLGAIAAVETVKTGRPARPSQQNTAH